MQKGRRPNKTEIQGIPNGKGSFVRTRPLDEAPTAIQYLCQDPETVEMLLSLVAELRTDLNQYTTDNDREKSLLRKRIELLEADVARMRPHFKQMQREHDDLRGGLK